LVFFDEDFVKEDDNDVFVGVLRLLCDAPLVGISGSGGDGTLVSVV
jgi:hypothetical protein